MYVIISIYTMNENINLDDLILLSYKEIKEICEIVKK